MARTRTIDKPDIHGRPWHMDADDRRHHGARRWSPEAIEALLEAFSRMESLYPPDWSDRDVVRFRLIGQSQPFAELDTSNPRKLELIILAGQVMDCGAMRKAGLKPRKVGHTLRVSLVTEADARRLKVISGGDVSMPRPR